MNLHAAQLTYHSMHTLSIVFVNLDFTLVNRVGRVSSNYFRMGFVSSFPSGLVGPKCILTRGSICLRGFKDNIVGINYF